MPIKPRYRNWLLNGLYLFIVLIGLIGLIGKSFNFPNLYRLSRLTTASIAPFVFTNIGGDYEPFAIKVSISYLDHSDHWVTKELDRRHFIPGPLSRRAIYHIGLGYSPALPEKLWKQVLRSAACNGGRLSATIGTPPDIKAIKVVIESLTPGRPQSWTKEVACNS